MGVALGGCTLPGAEKSGFTLADNEIELGLGIHGEKGVERSAMLPADQLTATLLDYIVEDMGLAAGARVALLVNGLGATPQMELDVVMRAAYDKLARAGSPSSGLGHAAAARHAGLRAAVGGALLDTGARAGRAAGGSTRTSTSPRRRWSRARPRPRPTPPASAGSPP